MDQDAKISLKLWQMTLSGAWLPAVPVWPSGRDGVSWSLWSQSFVIGPLTGVLMGFGLRNASLEPCHIT